MKLLGNLQGASNIAAWVVAIGLAGAWQYSSQLDSNKKTFSDAEVSEWNEKMKKKSTGIESVKESAAVPTPSTPNQP